MDLASEYWRDVQLSLIAYTFGALWQWRVSSPKWIRSLGSCSYLLLLGGIFWFRPWRASRGASLEYLLLSIIFTLWVFADLYGSWRGLQSIDELPEPGYLSRAVEEKIRARRAAREAR